MEGRPRFAADAMLGGLARHFRALGYDTARESPIGDATLVRRAVAERRVLLTRDVGIAEAWWIGGLVLLSSDDPLEQLREIGARFALDDMAAFTRCTRCNATLEPVSAADAGDAAPARRPRGESPAREVSGVRARLLGGLAHPADARDAGAGAQPLDGRPSGRGTSAPERRFARRSDQQRPPMERPNQKLAPSMSFSCRKRNAPIGASAAAA